MNKKLIIIAGAVVVLVIVLGVVFSAGKNIVRQSAGAGPRLPVNELYSQAASLEGKGELLEAQAAYQKLLLDYPDFKDMDQVQKKAEALNMRILFSALQTPQTVMHEVKSGDTLGKIAKQHNTTVEFIKKSNGLAGDTIRLGQRLRIWKGVFSVYIDKSQNILMLRSDSELVKTYQVATGKDNITPVGTFTIVDKLVDPVWFKSGAIIPPDSPKNILGTRWMGFDIPGYGIHGTTQPESLGQQVTAGCVRMRNEDVEELYNFLPVGTKVTIVD